MNLKSNNLIRVLPDLGSEYKIILDLLINQFRKKNWFNVLMFTADKGLVTQDNWDIKYGERTPAIFIKNQKLWVASAISGNSNHAKGGLPLTVEKWMKIEICQHVIDKKARDIFYVNYILRVYHWTWNGILRDVAYIG